MMARNNEQELTAARCAASWKAIYESMKPKEAAQIFDKLEINVLLGVIERMKENKVAPILASMRRRSAARQVTDMLADKKASARRRGSNRPMCRAAGGVSI